MPVPTRYIAALALLAAGVAFGIPAARACCAPAHPVVRPPVLHVPAMVAPPPAVRPPHVAPPAVHQPGPGGPGCCVTPRGPVVDLPDVSVGGAQVDIVTPRISVTQGGLTGGIGGGFGGVFEAGVEGGVFLGAQQQQQVLFSGGGGGVDFAGPSEGGFIGMLQVVGAEARTRTQTRTVSTVRAVRAVCHDERGMVHPASQTSGARTLTAPGEVFRCIEGTAMQVTIGRQVDGAVVYEGADVLQCARGEALIFNQGQLYCGAAAARPSCHERSLLRRYGPGEKLVTLTTTETWTETGTTRP